MIYSITVDIDNSIVKFDASFINEFEANRFADVMRDLIVEFSFVQTVTVM